MTIHLFNKEVTMLIVRYDKLSIHSAMRKNISNKDNSSPTIYFTLQ